MTERSQLGVPTSEANTGHGHVFPRPDGVKAKCGGPALCKVCALDLERDRLGRKVSSAEPDTPAEKAARALEWLLSPEGQAELRKSAEESKRIADLFRRARDISWERLHERFTI